MMPDHDKGKYFDLAELVRERADAEGAIVIIIKGGESRIAPDLPPTMMPYLPDILSDCANQSAAYLRRMAEEVRPQVEALLAQKKKRDN